MKRYWNRASEMSVTRAHGVLYHFYKYHDPDSDYYLGEECVNCEFSDIQRDIRSKQQHNQTSLDKEWL